MMKYVTNIILLTFFSFSTSWASYILIPMEAENQKNHLKAYGIAYWVIEQGEEAYWLLNYEGGAFAFPHNSVFEQECKIRDVSYRVIPNAQFAAIRSEISDPEMNQEVIKLEKSPKIAVYTPNFNARGERIQPWDDAVTMVLTFAEIPYDKIYDRDVLEGKLAEYDWLHLHHEDFTGQYGKFYANYANQPWYKENKRGMEELATSLGFGKVSKLKSAVVEKINDYVMGGGFMFAMCSATDTYDIALAAKGLDICDVMFDGDAADPAAQSKLDFSRTFAFKDFKLIRNPREYEFASIDHRSRKISPEADYFTLFDFSAKWDPVPTMLTQNHTRTVKGFMGQTTSYKRMIGKNKSHIKSDVLVLGETKAANEVRYIHGTRGFGTWTFYGGHDPEDYRHFVNDPETDLTLHPRSPGYRLILNNVLFPAAKKKKRKT
ncbi:MAG: asparagine synthetase B [Saprospiraceae bacterium]|nr:asparagine synthetase B [Saprospiraceae bacterium]